MNQNYYLEDRDLYYEIVLSKGKGYLTKNAENYLILIANKTIKKKAKNMRDEDEMMDCLQHGLLVLFEKWQGFNEKIFTKALPYFTEVFKRASADGYNILNNKKSYQKDYIKTISIDSANEGQGLHNI